MLCPKCGVEIDDNCEYCYSCGMKFNHVKAIEKVEEPQKKAELKPPAKPLAKAVSKVKSKKFIAISIITVIVILLAIIFVPKIFKKNGMKIAIKASEKIGSSIATVQKNAKIYVNDLSSCKAINKPADFDYIYESNKKIEVDGKKVPEWAITFYATDKDITKIYYRNYTQQDKYYKGIKLKKPVDLDDIKDAKTLSEVKKKFDFEPVSITFFNDKTAEYRYMFYYINKDKDEERKEFVITVDEKDKVQKVSETNIDELFNNIK